MKPSPSIDMSALGMSEREMFEKWYEIETLFIPGGDWNEDFGEYDDSGVQNAWEAWQAAGQSQPAVPDDVSPRHPEVIKWRNDAIERCADIADRYGNCDIRDDIKKLLSAAKEDE